MILETAISFTVGFIGAVVGYQLGLKRGRKERTDLNELVKQHLPPGMVIIDGMSDLAKAVVARHANKGTHGKTPALGGMPGPAFGIGIEPGADDLPDGFGPLCTCGHLKKDHGEHGCLHVTKRGAADDDLCDCNAFTFSGKVIQP